MKRKPIQKVNDLCAGQRLLLTDCDGGFLRGRMQFSPCRSSKSASIAQHLNTGSNSHCTRRKLMCAGFTLIELLVILVIISIVITIASIAVNQGSQTYTINQESERVFSTLNYAQKTAMLQSNTMGVFFSGNTYQFFQYTHNTSKEPWQVITNNKIFAKHALPAYINVHLAIPENNNPETDFLQPHIIINTDGSLMPFTLTLSLKKKSLHYQIMGSDNGDITMKKSEE